MGNSPVTDVSKVPISSFKNTEIALAGLVSPDVSGTSLRVSCLSEVLL